MVALAFTLRSSTSPGQIGAPLLRVKPLIASTPTENQPGEDVIPPTNWPNADEIQFESVSASYDDVFMVLENVIMQVKPGEKICVCGRSGSGKSSLLLTTLRLLDMSMGRIIIDGADLATVPRHETRSRIITIPQDQFVLTGSVRLNADPSGTIL
ncbi:hypothetical protein LOZ53_001818 [Ophidiomyces ophidiicola]|nr:hypothetical protein LOZ55_001924 [Ophidiomyces ophidiicola]KAI1986156.1 hypothetical protein LOZ51_006125 [Ophidiomyces ophidiicola]KAI1987672.1 hypothetical protein LOZ54_003486 [Ophidiomyces ophidiicola]KAI1994261.1 hypothetical protein LOZ53_001818 [Ophidiomyces ophidiicola]